MLDKIASERQADRKRVVFLFGSPGMANQIPRGLSQAADGEESTGCGRGCLGHQGQSLSLSSASSGVGAVGLGGGCEEASSVRDESMQRGLPRREGKKCLA